MGSSVYSTVILGWLCAQAVAAPPHRSSAARQLRQQQRDKTRSQAAAVRAAGRAISEDLLLAVQAAQAVH